MDAKRVRRLLMQQAIQAYQANRVTAARRNLKSVLYLNPKDVEALHWMQQMRGLPDSKDDLIAAEYDQQAEIEKKELPREERRVKPAAGLFIPSGGNRGFFHGLWRWGISTGLAVLAVLFMIAGCSAQKNNPTDFAELWQSAKRSVGICAPACQTIVLHTKETTAERCEIAEVNPAAPAFTTLPLGLDRSGLRPTLLTAVQLPSGGTPEPTALQEGRSDRSNRIQTANLTTPVTPISMRAHRTSKLLEVWSGDRLVRSYPMGTGPLEYTPLGTHRVIERAVLNPVDSDGSPNPYGTRWLGFDVAGEAGDYGIHGTPDPGQIGGEETLGCLVLDEKDLHELYNMIPSGATITIDNL